ncbi:C1 family peptidase [Nostoc sp. FACHB-190]|uniref:C1 family peptidase n=1 Tax=Nostoc sp. FACHB-190 TaxID=2692838 RepID=UPI001684B426|nr:C1 family peptidase [Nostoc sp. FACHB-190]MBD2301213.1 C1 family peptidase [Nostoc sp. FACHB-190]
MTKKGTGWIPDYPDVRDFTLDNDEIQSLSNKVQTQGSNSDVESLADTLRKALKIIAQQQEKITAQQQNQNEDDTKNINTLIEQLSGEINFVNLEMNNVLKEGMSDSEVLLIKNYLQRIISTWRVFQPCTESAKKYEVNYEPTITDTRFDEQTRQAIIKIFQVKQPYSKSGYSQEQHDGFIDKDDMEALKLLASGADFFRNIEKVKKLINKNTEIHENEIKTLLNECDSCFLTKDDSCFQQQEKICCKFLVSFLKKINKIDMPDDPVEKAQKYQGILGVYLYRIWGNLNVILGEFNNVNIQDNIPINAEIIQETRFLIQGIITNKNEFGKFISSFIESLKTPEFHFEGYEQEIFQTILTEITENKDLGLKFLGFTNKSWKIYQDIMKIPVLNKDEIQKNLKKEELQTILKTILKKLQYLMGVLYIGCPPKIPESLFQKIEIPISTPIPEIVVKLFINKLYKRPEIRKKISLEKESQDIKKLVKSLKENNSYPSLQSLNEILIQILMPLGQYNNLSKAVEAGIVKIWSFLSEETDNNENIKKIIQETMREYNVTVAQDYSLINEIYWQEWDHKNFETKIDSIFEEIQSILKSSNSSSETSDSTQTFGFLPPKSRATNKHLKKPLFQISSSQLSLLLEGGGFQETKADNTSKKSLEKLNNSLLFPINKNLHQQIKAKIDKTTNKPSNEQSVFLSLPEFVDLSYWCSPVEDQGSLNSCTAHAGIALIEYAQKKSSGNYTDASPLFLYQVTRNLMQREGDSGASVRDTMKAMVTFGVCPEEYWPYNEDKFNEEPTSFCYSFAENYKTIKYFRLDYGQISKYALLSQVKLLLVAEIPCIFGFTLYNSVYDEVNFRRGHIPLPSKRDKVIGGHTVVAVGYHDRKIIENEDGERFEGALLIRNSWGNRWGQGGYGWMPYDYIIKGLTADWWSLLKAEWLATGNFGAGASAWNANKGGNGNGPPNETPP